MVGTVIICVHFGWELLHVYTLVGTELDHLCTFWLEFVYTLDGIVIIYVHFGLNSYHLCTL